MIGRVLGQRYEITENIDAGGMAYIYKAVCKKTGETVAVKVLKEELSKNAEYVRRFKKEAESAFAINHVGVVRVMDIGCDDGIYYMVMEYVDNDTLKAYIEKKTRLEEREVIEYALQICSALTAAHKKGIIHRDIKPRNVLMSSSGHVKITDFGIAKSLTAEDENESQVIGSVHYISPEQAKGERVDARTDIYSLGIMLFEMLTGTLPYTGDQTISVALKQINEPLRPPIEINDTLSMSINNIILKATSKNKRDRYKSVSAMKSDLVRALIDSGGSFVDLPEKKTVMRVKPQRDSRKNKIWKLCILVVMAALLVMAIVFGADALKSTVDDVSAVPDTSGLSEAAAQLMLGEEGFEVNTLYAPSETVIDGMILSQSPEPGVELAAGSTITITVSTGPDNLIMPDVSGMTPEDAEAVIIKMDLVMDDIAYEAVEEGDMGIVLSQSPLPGDVVEDGDVVTLVVSAEPVVETAVLPQVTELMLEQAVSLLAEAGFTNCFVYGEESELPEGTVTAQKPEQGMQVPPGSDIDLWVSDYLNRPFMGNFNVSMEIEEVETKVKIVLEDTIEGHVVNFIIAESVEDIGVVNFSREIAYMRPGPKNVKIYINNIETYVDEVEFFVRNVTD